MTPFAVPGKRKKGKYLLDGDHLFVVICNRNKFII